MEKQFKVEENGQAVQTQDLELLGETSGLADDRVLAELLRLDPYDGVTVDRGILGYGLGEDAGVSRLVVTSNLATGSVAVAQFRAVVGSRAVSPSLTSWRDIRSAIYTGGAQPLTANSSGNPRLDLLYAAVAIDVDGPTAVRLVKDPTTEVIAPASVATYTETTVAIGVVTGTPGVTPAYPTIPADSGGTYYIPIAYIRVPNGFGAGSTVVSTNIAHVIPPISLSLTTGASVMEPANRHYTTTVGLPTNFGATGALPTYLPPTMTGAKTLVFYTDFGVTDAITTNMTIDTRGWGGRGCKVEAFFDDGSGGKASYTNFEWLTPVIDVDLFDLDDTDITIFNASSSVRVYADFSDGFPLRVAWTGTPGVTMTLLVTFTGSLL